MNGVRISDPKIYLDEHSPEADKVLANIVLPDIGTLHRKEFQRPVAEMAGSANVVTGSTFCARKHNTKRDR